LNIRNEEEEEEIKKFKNTFVSWALDPKSQITAFILPFSFSNKMFELFLKKINKNSQNKNNSEKKVNDLRSLWAIPNEFIIFIPDAISQPIFIIVSLGIFSEERLIKTCKSVSYNYIIHNIKFRISSGKRKEKKNKRILLW